MRKKNLNDTKHIIGGEKTPTYRVSIPFFKMLLEVPTKQKAPQDTEPYA
jgi:hypothetical protein